MEFNKRAFITEAETLMLIRYTKGAIGDVVEVGTYLGGTAENMAPHIPEGRTLWAIDFFGGFEGHMNPSTIYHKHLVNFGNVFFVMGDSRKLGRRWNRDIGLLFIDGDHHVKAVLEDFEVWTPWLMPGGVLAVHDSAGFEGGARPEFKSLNGYTLIKEEGPAQAVKNAVSSGEWEVIEKVDSMTFLMRAERRG